jgi:hypothetical protein
MREDSDASGCSNRETRGALVTIGVGMLVNTSLYADMTGRRPCFCETVVTQLLQIWLLHIHLRKKTRTLAELRLALHADIKNRISAEVEKDLTKHPVWEIERHLLA